MTTPPISSAQPLSAKADAERGRREQQVKKERLSKIYDIINFTAFAEFGIGQLKNQWDANQVNDVDDFQKQLEQEGEILTGCKRVCDEQNYVHPELKLLTDTITTYEKFHKIVKDGINKKQQSQLNSWGSLIFRIFGLSK